MRQLVLSMIYAGFKHVESWWNYKDVISPFYRMYYIEKGCGRIYLDGDRFELTSGSLFLIPKFTCHSYECDDFMDQYYICFFDDLNDVLGVPYPNRLTNQVKASRYDRDLFFRYLELNPASSLTNTNPAHYDKGVSYRKIPGNYNRKMSDCVESMGILIQLFSRFVTNDSWDDSVAEGNSEKFGSLLLHIAKNISRQITIPEMAGHMCMSPDHFTKMFKKRMGVTPSRYLDRKLSMQPKEEYGKQTAIRCNTAKLRCFT